MPSSVPVTLASLTAPTTPDEMLTISLGLAASLGLSTTAWQPIGMVSTLVNVNATIAADESSVVALIAQGGYASLAALMVDTTGAPITTWMALRATDQYGITPGTAQFASGNVPVSNVSSSTYTYSPSNPLHFQNVTTGATYTSTGAGSIAPGAGAVAVSADVAGSASTSGAGVVLALITPLTGVTCTSLTTSLVGSDAESNAALLARGQNKLATLAPIESTSIPGPVTGGPAGVYSYVATSIPQSGSASAVPPYAVTANVTRTNEVLSTSSGVVTLYIANASGSSSPTDVAAVNAAIQALVVPDGVTVTTVSAAPIAISVTATVYIRLSSGVTAAGAVTNIDDALANYYAGVPVGGLSTVSPNIVPLSELNQVIFQANNGTIDVEIASPTSNPSVGANGVPIAGTNTISVVFR